jgi:hypothetical protein
LAVAGYGNDAVSAAGRIFPPDGENDYHPFGPVDVGGGSPWTGWDNGGEESGSYHIVLTGAEFVTIAQPHDVGPAMSASWYYEYDSGHGVMIHLLDQNTAWTCWFAFDLDGNPAWICGLGTIDGGVITFVDAFTVEGGNFPPLFDAAKIQEVPWGDITITFVDCDNARMDWTTSTPGFQSGSMPLSRLTSLWANDCQ